MLVQWRGPDALYPEKLAPLMSRLDRSKPLPTNFPRINGHSLAVYEWQNLSPARLFELQIPFVFSSLDVVRQGFVASGRQDRSEQ